MKIAIINTTNEARSIIDHANGEVTDGLRADSEGIFVDHPLFNPNTNLPVANTCIGVQTFFANADLRGKLYKDLGVTGGKPSAVLYTLFNGSEFGDWMEVVPNRGFMNGNVGPTVLWGNGTGLKVEGDINVIIPSMKGIGKALQELGYRGEFYVEISNDFQVTSFSFGHFYAYFAMYAELSTNTVDQLLDFIFGVQPDCKLNTLFCMSNLVSHQPYPVIMENQTPSLDVPPNARKHVWYLKIQGLVEVALVTIVGRHLNESRHRMKVTLRNMTKRNRDVQYRTDYGLHHKFVIMQERYLKLAAPVVHVRTPQQD